MTKVINKYSLVYIYATELRIYWMLTPQQAWNVTDGAFCMAQSVCMLWRRVVTCVVKQRMTGSSPVWGSRTAEVAKLLAVHWPPVHRRLHGWNSVCWAGWTKPWLRWKQPLRKASRKLHTTHCSAVSLCFKREVLFNSTHLLARLTTTFPL
jgi:hypothetical protein